MPDKIDVKEYIVPAMAFLAFVISMILLWVNWNAVKTKVQQ
ncbi:hypothetical protein [Candidatus Nitrososphaera gargensis]|nr:hypothetical protein [Candidatus Nitrososphaera gargensis]